MNKKIYINQNIERLFSLILSLTLILTLNIILTNTLFKNITQAANLRLIHACTEFVEDYSEAVEGKLNEIESTLDLLYAKIAYKNYTKKEIMSFLLSEKENTSIPFSFLAFSDENGIILTPDGTFHDISDRYYFKKIMSGSTKFCVSSVLDSMDDGTPSLVFARAIRDENNKIAGLLCAACTTSVFETFINEIKIGNNRKVSIRDINGKFIKHYNSRWTGWVFHSGIQNPKDFPETEEEDNVMEATDTEGRPVYVFYRELDLAMWTVAVTVPIAEFDAVKIAQHKYQNFIIELIVVVLSLLFLIEIWAHSFMERHQILSTHIDSLTHLWVRSYFEKEANKILKRYPNSKFLLIETDIRGFKFINQNYGENQANRLLLFFSKLLYEDTRVYDGILCRGYADHFFILVKVSSVHKGMQVFKANLKKIMALAKKAEVPFIPKFGLSFYLPKMKDEIHGVQILISRASFAKSTIKENALQQFAIYDDSLLQKSKNENFIETHMEAALANKEFFVMYQPKIDLETEKVVGAEALVRWQSPKLGYMPPNSFVPLFERNNFIVKLDFYVYDQVFKFIRNCMDNNEPTVPISVNVSRNHDKPEKFVHSFMALLKKYDIPPTLIEVELLERATLDKNLLREITIMLQKEGFKVAMDDFGSGESSLNMLSTIPVNILKFDRSFLFASDSAHGKLDATSETFIRTLVDLGKNLKKETIFEGVETAEQRDFLRKIKCDQVQGYFYSKPLREDEFMTFLKSHQ